MTYWTGKRTSTRFRSLATWSRSRWLSSGDPSNQGMLAERVTTLSPWSAETGMNVRSPTRSRVANSPNSARMSSNTYSDVVDQVHLVDADDEVRDTEEGGDERVSPALLGDPSTGIEQDEGDVGRRRAGDHVAGVLDVAGGVGDDELPARRGEVAVGDVDGDALLALGAQAVGDEREVRVVVAAVAADPLDGGQLVIEERLRVEQQPADQRALAVVDRAGGGEAQEVARHQK